MKPNCEVFIKTNSGDLDCGIDQSDGSQVEESIHNAHPKLPIRSDMVNKNIIKLFDQELIQYLHTYQSNVCLRSKTSFFIN